MNTLIKLLAAAALIALLLPSAAFANPSLKGDITVNAGIVTVGDMFDNPGELSETAIFRAPSPGTTGVLQIADIQQAARAIGLTDFDNVGYLTIRVARATTVVDAPALDALIADELNRRGALAQGITADTHFDQPNVSFNAEQTATPATLSDLRYSPDTGAFSARFSIAGIDAPVELTGTIVLLTTAPRLLDTLPAGTVLSADDFETASVPVSTANAGGYADLDELVGKQLVHQSRAGIMLRPNDVAEPTVVTRSEMVTVLLKTGPMTLTVKGQAMSTVAAGEPVDVLNTVTKKILHGVAQPDGTVAIQSALTTAGL